MLMYYEYLSVMLRYLALCDGKVLFVVLGKQSERVKYSWYVP